MASYTFMDDIHIEDWQRFLDNNAEIEEALNLCCSNVADMIANITSINAMVPGINDAFAGLKKVTVPEIDEGGDLLSLINEFSNYFKGKSLKIVSGISYAELVIDAYNNGTDVDAEATSMFGKILQGTADSNIYWVVNEALKTTTFGAIGFLLAYGTDFHNEGGNYVVGDGVNKLFNVGSNTVFGSNPPLWMNAAVGAVVVAGYTAAVDYLTDKGNMTSLDWTRLGLDAGAAALSYAEWTMVAGAIGGVPGVVVAGLLAIPTSFVFGSIKDLITGDNIIDTFERNGETYEVPRNGNGKNGTWDVLVDNYESNMEEHNIGGQLYSEHDYKRKLYSDWEDLVYRDTGRHLTEEYEFYHVDEEWNKILEKTASYDDPQEASYYFSRYMEEEASYDAKQLWYVLSVNYGFNQDEMYQYLHNNL